MSSGKFITNKEIVLSETIAKIFPTTSKIDFLVGFFYFSGFGELYKGMEDKKLKGKKIKKNRKNGNYC